MRIIRVRARPSRWTFTIPCIAALLTAYVGTGQGWIDPFAGRYSPAEFTNDLNPDNPAIYHLEAVDFVNSLTNPGLYSGILFDPPYSYRQISESYGGVGLKATRFDTSSQFYNRVMNAACDKIKPGGLAISFGWNSNGFGANRGFEMIELLIVAHGQHHNDTLVVVERKQ